MDKKVKGYTELLARVRPVTCNLIERVFLDAWPTIDERLQRIENLLLAIFERQQVREWYSIEEFAGIVGRAELTCREWCRRGRVRGKKCLSGRGASTAWVISHTELQRYQREGLLPCERPDGHVTSVGGSL